MKTDTLQQLWKSCLDAYSDIPPDKRERLLRQSVTDDVVFTGPKEDDQGFGKLVEHIGQFQKKSRVHTSRATSCSPNTDSSYRSGRYTRRVEQRSPPVTPMRDSTNKASCLSGRIFPGLAQKFEPEGNKHGRLKS